MFTPLGELLTTGERLFSVSVVNTRNPARFSLPMPAYDPADLSLVDLPVFVQGLCTGAPARLSNALDVVIGR